MWPEARGPRTFLRTERNSSWLLSLSQWCPVPLGPNLVTLYPSHATSAVCVPTDPKILSLSGKVLPSCDLARRYGLQDVDGKSSGPAASLDLPSFSFLLTPSLSLFPYSFLPHIPLSLFSRGGDVQGVGNKGLTLLLFLLSAGRPVEDYLSLSSALSYTSNMGWLAPYIPGFLRIPKWIMTLYTGKF